MKKTEKVLLIAASILAVVATAVCIAAWVVFALHIESLEIPLYASAVMAHSWVVLWMAKEL